MPLRRRGQAHPRALRRRALQPRGLRQHRAQRHRRPVGRRVRTTSSSTPRPTRARTCATSCATRRRSSCRARSRRRSRLADEDRAITGIHDIALHPARSRRRSAASRCASAAARRSCRASRRRSTTSSAADDGEYLKVAEAVFRIFDRQDWLRVNRARARIKVFVDKYRHRRAAQARSRRSSRATGSTSATSTSRALLFVDDEEANAPAVPPRYASAQRRPQRVRPLRAGQRHRPAPGGLLRRRGPGPARRPDAPSSSAALARHRATTRGGYVRTHRRPEPRAALGARRDALRRLAARCASSASATPAPTQVNDVVSCPGTDSCKLGITSSMGLNAAVRERVDAMDITDPLTRRSTSR